MADERKQEATEQSADSMPMEDLADLVRQSRDQALEPEPSTDESAEVEAVEAEDSEPEAAAEETQAEETLEAEADDAESDQQESAEQSEESEQEPKPTLEELQARLDAETASRKHFESVAGRWSSEAGHLKRKVGELEAAVRQVTERRPDDQDYQAEPAREPYRPPVPQNQNGSAELIQGAIQLAGKEFALKHPDALDGSGNLSQEMQAELAAIAGDTSSILTSNDPAYAMAQVSGLLEAGYRKLEAKKATDRAQEIERRRADQAADLKRRKRASAASSGRSGSSAQKKKQPDPGTMPMEDLAKLIESTNTG